MKTVKFSLIFLVLTSSTLGLAAGKKKDTLECELASSSFVSMLEGLQESQKERREAAAAAQEARDANEVLKLGWTLLERFPEDAVLAARDVLKGSMILDERAPFRPVDPDAKNLVGKMVVGFIDRDAFAGVVVAQDETVLKLVDLGGRLIAVDTSPAREGATHLQAFDPLSFRGTTNE